MKYRTVKNSKATRYRDRSTWADMPLFSTRKIKEAIKNSVPVPIPELDSEITSILLKLKDSFGFTDSDVRSLGCQASKHGYTAADYRNAYGAHWSIYEIMIGCLGICMDTLQRY